MAMEPNSNHSNATVRTPDTDTDISLPITATKQHLSFFNGAPLNRHHRLHPQLAAAAAADDAVSYKECLKNHAAALGGHAQDGCGEFLPSPSASHADPSSLTCAACGCHRNFHRRESPYDRRRKAAAPPPRHSSDSPSPPVPPQSPPPPSSNHYSSAPHMLLALSAGGGGGGHQPHPAEEGDAAGARTGGSGGVGGGRKRCRTKFSPEQKERMRRFADRLGWRMPKGGGGEGGVGDEGSVEEFCSKIGVSREILKVWMHNNKFTSGKRSKGNVANGNNGDGIDREDGHGIPDNGNIIHSDPVTVNFHVSTNGSSSSS